MKAFKKEILNKKGASNKKGARIILVRFSGQTE